MSRGRRCRLAALLLATLASAGLTLACGTTASDSNAVPGPEAPGVVPAETAPATSSAPRQALARATAALARAVAEPVRQVTVPAGTVLHLTLTTSLASDSSHAGDAVTADLARAVVVDGHVVLPAGSTLEGSVTDVEGAGRVKGRASLRLDFRSMTAGGVRYALAADSYSRVAPATKGEDAGKIGIGAGAGAIIGGLFGGKKGVAEGAAIGGGAGTGVVLATRGKEVRLGSGTDISTPLTAPLTVRVTN